jgi:hypothetical protein
MAIAAPTRRSGRGLVGRAILAALVALVALPVYLTMSPAWRPAAVRVSCAVIVAIGCAHARRWAREALAVDTVSALEAPPPPPPEAQLDARFLRLRDDLVAGTRSRRYFDVILWPRLHALAGSDLPRPAGRRVLARRGPSLQALEALVALIERRR